ncbi:Chromatin remodeling factor mit1 [Cladobotryum mycophilum]|uniref:Chromatin remodeling factor mit1 n=1 Tax=Cladobotryum mycophilum TaxID=491253 RepID=A0ABR0S531_9HYPO
MDDVEFSNAPVEIVSSDSHVEDVPVAPQSLDNDDDDVESAKCSLGVADNRRDQTSRQSTNDSRGFDVDSQLKNESGEHTPDDLPRRDPRLSHRLEVAISEISLERRNEHSEVYSNIVERVINFLSSRRDKKQYGVEFTDGREDLLSLDELVRYENGKAALDHFREDRNATDMSAAGRKRKDFSEDEWDSIVDNVASDRMDLDDDDDEGDDFDDGVRRAPTRQIRLLRSRESSNRQSLGRNSVSSDNDDGEGSHVSSQPTRRLRERKPQQLKLMEMTFKNSSADQDRDELALDNDKLSDDDGDFFPVISDLGMKKGRPSRTKPRSKRLLMQKSRSTQLAKMGRKTSEDSDIEFEQPRRSSRATRNVTNMQDDSFMDDDSFYIVDDRAPAVPKVISIKEVFQPISPDSSFGSVHMDNCHTCSGTRQRGQLLPCQGCSLVFHKGCIGYRSAREHQATKVGEDNFVLQCKFCIGLYKKRDQNAPAHNMCQGCKKTGKSCAAFSEKKTSRQEEKMREQNEGIDPITPVRSELINNADTVLFRCSICYRGWHQEHLPSTSGESIETDIKTERLKDYSVDWRCNECSTTKYKLHRLVAWRPVKQTDAQQTNPPAFADISEDGKEYLVKWQGTSYAHCTWVPGAWLHGVAAGAMRTAFGKRAAEQDLLKWTTKDAVPDEFLMADVILNAKMELSASNGKSKEADLANISRVTKIFVKFQGLGYDDVVWDSVPSADNPDVYNAFVDAYHEYVEGKFFRTEPYSRIRERIKAYKNQPFVEVESQPDGLKRGKLMGYQIEGLNWLLQNYHHGRSVVLADEMGLGKTVQVVGLVTSLIQDEPRCWPFLIVVPNSTCPNWRREFKQWAPDIRVVTYHGGKESQELAYKYELFPNGSTEMKAQAVIMSYDSAQDPRTQSLFKSVHWAGLVVDEGQRLKSDKNLLYLALQAMKIPFRLLLTGTPLQNNKRELFNLLQFIDETQNAEKLDEEFSVLDKETLPKLHEKIRPYFLRRTKAGVLKFLPPMAQIILPVTMTVIQEKLSKSIMAKNPQLIQAVFANSKMNRKERGSLNNILMQLRKCLCHPFMYSDAIEERHHDPTVLYRNLVEASAKLLLLEIMLPKLKERGHRVLIFSQFLQQLDIIEDFLAGMGYEYRRLDGQISSLEKQRRIDAYNEPGSGIFAFLLSTRAGGVGINLATADTVIIMDPDFNPHQDMQALSRAHRIGQKNKVLCFQLMTKDSVEERIMQVGRKKMALDHALIESMDDDDLAGDDLESILKHGAQALFDDDYQKTAIHYDSTSVDKLLDRTQVEQTATNDEGSAETQFTYARVWANDKLGFEDNQDLGEEQAPEPINSSVWDQILAHREEQARREAEANQEVLGRGARRRMAINYKTNAIDQTQLPDDIGQESDDSSDDFAGADSHDESDDEAQATTKGKKRKLSHIQLKTPTATPIKDVKNNKIDRQSQQSKSKSSSRLAHKKRNPENRRALPIKQARTPTSQTHRANWPNSTNAGPNHRNVSSPPPKPPPDLLGATNRTKDYDHYKRYLKLDSSQGRPPVNIPSTNGTSGTHNAAPQNLAYTVSQRDLAYIAQLHSEAQLRLAIDMVQRSKLNALTKQSHISVLLHRLREISMHNGTRQQ